MRRWTVKKATSGCHATRRAGIAAHRARSALHFSFPTRTIEDQLRFHQSLQLLGNLRLVDRLGERAVRKQQASREDRQ